MAYQFTKDLETGNTLIDTQHRQLVDAVNALLDACSKGAGRAQVQKTAQFLLDYTTKHFADEEKLQVQYRYPDYPRHKQLHEGFKKTAADLVQQLQQQGPTVVMVGKVNSVLATWLIQHIKGEDKKLATYISSTGKA